MDVWQFILEHAAKEWDVIRGAPGAAFVLFVLAFTLLWFAFNWRYAGQIESLTGQLNLLKDQVADYRERLGLVPADTTAYSRLTNEELRTSVDVFLVKLKEFAKRADRWEIPDLHSERTRALANAKTDEEKAQVSQQVWAKQTAMLIDRTNSRISEYQQNYRAQALVLRDEMMRRLPPHPTQMPVFYESLAGPSPVHDIATDLERLSSLLPTRKSRN